MRTLRRWAMRVWGMFGRERAEQEFSAELQSHLEMHTDDGMRAGLSEEEARRQARLTLGGIGENRERYFEQQGLPVVEHLARDVGYSLRLLKKNPSFAAMAVLSLALGIGANTAMFSLVNAAILRPPPYPEPERLMHTERDATMEQFESLRQMDVFRDVAGWRAGAERRVDFEGRQEWTPTALVTAGFFRTLGVGLAQGEEFAGNASDRTAILSHALWQRISGGKNDAVGRVVALDGQPYTVIGVTAESLWLPEKADVFVPLRSEGTVSDLGTNTQVTARLKEGAARTAVYGEVRMVSLQRWLAGDVRARLLMLFGAVGLVLLIACFNLAGLLLARLSARQREISVRLALGCGRGRLLQQLLVENLIVCTMGGAAGVLGAYWLMDSFVALLPFRLVSAGGIGIDSNVLLFAMSLTLAAGAMVSVAPGWISASWNVQEALRQSSRGASGRTRLRSALVVTEIAAATALLAGAGILMESLYRLNRQPLGFVPEGRLTFYAPPERGLDVARKQVRQEMLLEQLGALPGVRAVAAANVLPLDGMNNFPAQRSGHPEQTIGGMEIRIVTANYFETMGVRLVSGRGFGTADRENGAPVVLINEALAKAWWPGGNAVGDRIDLGYFRGKALMPELTREVIGVVGDMKTVLLAEPARPTLFLPLEQARWYGGGMSFVLRAEAGSGLEETVRRKVLEIAPGQRVNRMRWMERIVEATTANPRFDATILGSFALFALVLAMLGVYGVLAYSVARRTEEIGTRMALGASPGQVLGLVMRQGLGLIVAGLAMGIPGAWAVTKMAGVPAGPLRFAAVAVILSAVGFVASWLPARRAMRVDPVTALRAE